MSRRGGASVYLYYDCRGLLIYIGITSRGMTRQAQHNDTAEWWRFVARQEVEHYPTRDEAALREKFLIRDHKPPFNRQHNPQHPELREAYLRLFGPARAAMPPAGDHPLATCGEDEDCNWHPDHAGDLACGSNDCAVCHSHAHAYFSGMDLGQGVCGSHMQRWLTDLSRPEGDDPLGPDIRELMEVARRIHRQCVDRGGDVMAFEIRRHLLPAAVSS